VDVNEDPLNDTDELEVFLDELLEPDGELVSLLIREESESPVVELCDLI
jgi:hypothetical protein